MRHIDGGAGFIQTMEDDVKIQDVIKAYEKRDATARAAAIANGEYHEKEQEFMTELGELAETDPDLVIEEEMLVYIPNSFARLNADVWIVKFDLTDWRVISLRKIAVFDSRIVKREAGR